MDEPPRSNRYRDMSNIIKYKCNLLIPKITKYRIDHHNLGTFFENKNKPNKRKGTIFKGHIG